MSYGSDLISWAAIAPVRPAPVEGQALGCRRRALTRAAHRPRAKRPSTDWAAGRCPCLSTRSSDVPCGPAGRMHKRTKVRPSVARCDRDPSMLRTVSPLAHCFTERWHEQMHNSPLFISSATSDAGLRPNGNAEQGWTSKVGNFVRRCPMGRLRFFACDGLTGGAGCSRSRCMAVSDTASCQARMLGSRGGRER